MTQPTTATSAAAPVDLTAILTALQDQIDDLTALVDAQQRRLDQLETRLRAGDARSDARPDRRS